MSELTNPHNTSLSTHFADSDDDFVGMRQRDHLLPRAKLLQATSPDVIQGRFHAGTVIDSATKGILVTPRTDGKFIVPFMYWNEWIEWNVDRNAPKTESVVERSTDPTSKLARRAESWETRKDPRGRDVAVVTEYYNFICALIDPKAVNYSDIYLFNFARSAHRVGKQLLNALYRFRTTIDGVSGRPPMYFTRWAYRTDMVTKEQNTYYVPTIGDGCVNPPADISGLKAIADGFKARKREIIERNTSRDERNEDDGGEAAPRTAAATTSEM